MSKPLLFISHKHDDAQIAETVAKFARTLTGGSVDVFLSSNPDFEGPRVGKPLNKELKDALWRAGVVLLIYSSKDKDWDWCMWECGLADDPNSPDTKVVVLQCLSDKPTVFESAVRVQAWQKDSVVQLAYRFGQPDFFPSVGEPVTGLSENELKERAERFHADLLKAIPREPPETWSAWPHFQLALPRESVETMFEEPEEKRLAAARAVLIEEGRVTESSSGLAQLFGKVELSSNATFKELVHDWQEGYPDREPVWVQALAVQILEGARKRSPKGGAWARLRALEGDSEFVIGIGRIKKNQVKLLYDCYCLGLGSVGGITSRMTRTDRMFFIDLEQQAPDQVVLVDLLRDLEGRGWTRVPVLEGKRARYIAHVSMIDRFIRISAIAGRDVKPLTLADILKVPEMKRMFENTYVLLDANKTVRDALIAMQRTERCEDVFVTGEDGDVLGWLTDADVWSEEIFL